MGNQTMMKNKQPVEIQRNVSQEQTAVRMEKEEQRQMDRQLEERNFVEQLSEHEEYIPGAEELDISSIEIRDQKQDDLSAAQGSMAFQQMSVDAEKRKEYLKNGQRMPKAMEHKYAKEFQKANK